MSDKKNWPVWEIFVRSKNGLEHRHFGSLHAADAEMALENARDVYTRRSEGVSIWVVESKNITASNPSDNGELFEPAQDKVYRHPTFYELPEDDPIKRKPDITKAINILNWKPKVSRKKGLEKTFNYFRSLTLDELNKKEYKFA